MNLPFNGGSEWPDVFDFFKRGDDSEGEGTLTLGRRQQKEAKTRDGTEDPRRKDPLRKSSFQGDTHELKEMLASCKPSQIEVVAAKSHAEVMEKARMAAQKIIGAAHDRRYFVLDKKVEAEIVIKQVLAEAEAENKPKDIVLGKLRMKEISRV
ncbi:hypothetical protein GUITHDRAFT_116816 [Guillardia theta CCMP2712]|uniref:Uncharacterized protein n=1 Tax=Guillardia theta (strain CCMP2712) TaxID=905079 RepID=L1IM21_GUITC|nr:hypothetical protein GUITHDRAFT_116816 [Guillardia theta CCMP2712]EKX36949.1 hypothetical protein GUITHDRAFT_116816 [Guillardia theta CCMP2712]|eukprot:XP_005823929.1 hypothetical protein GUITHDRAFT_116816 [Guillardia theta CCMP2712]